MKTCLTTVLLLVALVVYSQENKTFYSDGSKQSEVLKLDDGRQKQIVYYPSGKVSSVSYTIDGRTVGVTETYYENGQLQTRGKVKTMRFIKLPEKWRRYGRRKKMTVMSGEWLSWYDDGKPMKRIVWRRGYMRVTTSWDKEGKVTDTHRFPFKKTIFGNFGEYEEKD